MSTLTKILVVLLTFSVIALCPIVATYVATANNYRSLYEKEKKEQIAAKASENETKTLLKENIGKTDVENKRLNEQIASLSQKVATLEVDLQTALRAKADLEERVKSWTAVVADFTNTNDKQGTLLNNTLAELDKAKTEQIKLKKELDETTAYLRERIAIVADLEAKNKQLVEQSTEYQNRLNKMLQSGGKEAAAPAASVSSLAPASKGAVMDEVKEIGLSGLVSEVIAKDSMASINVGSVDGVKKGMKFHITRGSEFVRDILIIDVEEEKAVGVFDIGSGIPKVGDNASTNF